MKLLSYAAWFHLCFNLLLGGVLFKVTDPDQLACHSSEDEDRKRKKRQTASSVDVEDTSILREYFSRCLQRSVGEIWDWPSVIDVTILDTFWYETSALSNCSRSSVQDTNTCWISRLSAYLRNTSFLLQPSTDCINQYSADTSNGLSAFTEFTVIPVPPQPSSAPVLCLIDPLPPLQPNSPPVRMYANCNEESETNFVLTRPSLDFPSIFQFVQQHTFCSSELDECDDMEVEILTDGDPNVLQWPYRLQALLKTQSPLKAIVSRCNERVFPTASDWTAWGECSVTCGGGARSRTRQCMDPTDSTCQPNETEACSETVCPECMISMFSRRACGTSRTSREACQQMGCCYSSMGCYRARQMSMNNVMDSCSQQGGGHSFFRFRPTVGSIAISGGENGFPGSPVSIQCDESAMITSCGGPTMDCFRCVRSACCWSIRRQRCFRSSIQILEVREECPEGKINPPACIDAPPSNMSQSCQNQTRPRLLDLAFLIDESGSIGNSNFDQIISFATSLVDQLVVGLEQTRISVNFFSNRPTGELSFIQSTSAAAVNQALEDHTYLRGGTYIARALNFVAREVFISAAGDRVEVPNILLFISDGKSSDQIGDSASTLKSTGVRIIVIGIGRSVSISELTSIASDPVQNNLFLISQFDQLLQIVGGIITEVCN